MGPRSSWRAMVDGVDTTLDASARAGECIGRRRCDVDTAAAPPTIPIDGGAIHNRAQGIQRESVPEAHPPASSHHFIALISKTGTPLHVSLGQVCSHALESSRLATAATIEPR